MAANTTPRRPDPIPPDVHVPTSDHLVRMLDGAERSHVTVGWLMTQLGERSFGITLFLMAVLALVPGASTIVGLVIAWPAIQMLLRRRAPTLPGAFARRRLAVDRVARAVTFIAPRLRWLEKFIRPRWPRLFLAAEPLTGIVTLLLGLTLISPFPFSHVLPACIIMLLAIAFLEEDGLVLLLSIAVALASLAITTAALWGAIETADWIGGV